MTFKPLSKLKKLISVVPVGHVGVVPFAEHVPLSCLCELAVHTVCITPSTMIVEGNSEIQWEMKSKSSAPLVQVIMNERADYQTSLAALFALWGA
jgi:hypothetical protein